MIAPARKAAFSALRAIAKGRSDLGDALAATRDALADERDRALVTELVTGTLRARAGLDHQIARRIPRPLGRLDPEVLDALRLGAFQLLHLSRVPPSAVVNDAVEMCRASGKASARGFVNAVLRKLAREREALEWPPRPSADAGTQAWAAWLEIEYSHPAWLVGRWIARYGLGDTEAWLQFNNQVPALCFATNTARGSRDALAARLADEGVETSPTHYSPLGLIVTGGTAMRSAAFRDGLCLVQDEASQLIPLLAAAREGETIYDACASPGGKSVALVGAAGDGCVISADVRPRRVRLLLETLQRCGLAPRVVHVADSGPLPFADEAFDAVLVDAPCSGLGTLRRDPDIRWRRAESDLAPMGRAQLTLLERLAPLAKPGGRIVYSTCSSEPEEDEDVVQAFLLKSPAFRVSRLAGVPALPAAVRAMETPDGYLRTFPHRDGLEAFFGAVLAKL